MTASAQVSLELLDLLKFHASVAFSGSLTRSGYGRKAHVFNAWKDEEKASYDEGIALGYFDPPPYALQEHPYATVAHLTPKGLEFGRRAALSSGAVFGCGTPVLVEYFLLGEACARAAHEANRAYCIATGDLSQPSWDDAPDWQKSSAINGVQGALDGATPEQSHISWLNEKRDNGWTYGPVKDPEKKEHPCFVAYCDLPVEQQAKDHLFLSVVRAMAKALQGA